MGEYTLLTLSRDFSRRVAASSNEGMKTDQHHACQSSAHQRVLGAWCWPLIPDDSEPERRTMDDTICSACGESTDTRMDTAENRHPCPKCGATTRTNHVSLTDSVVFRDGIGVKAERPSQKKPFAEDLSMPSFSISRQKLVHHQRLIDRDNDHYFERITDYETGEVVHQCEEPLSSHREHGSARKKKG